MDKAQKIKAMMEAAGLKAEALYAQGMDISVSTGEELAAYYLEYPLSEDDERYKDDEEVFELTIEDKINGAKLVEVDGEIYLVGHGEVRGATPEEAEEDGDEIIIDMNGAKWVKA